jgi:hypothetical protein
MDAIQHVCDTHDPAILPDGFGVWEGKLREEVSAVG